METHVTSKIDAIDAVEQIQYIVGELENIGTMDSVSVYEIFNLAIKNNLDNINNNYF